jgi:hypothetical protein
MHDKAVAGKRKFVEEAKIFLLLFLYLALLLGGFGWYKRLILLEYQYEFSHYGYSVVEAAVLAKLMLVGNAMGFFKRLHKGPLIVASLFQTLVFSCIFIFFSLEEETVLGLIHGHGISWGFHKLLATSWMQVLADFIIIFMCFVPLFAIWELAKVLGPEQLAGMFFRKRPPAGVALMTAAAPGPAASRGKEG